MDDDDFEELDDVQLAALDAQVSNLSRDDFSNSSQEPAQTQADFFQKITENEFAEMDEAIENLGQANDNRNDITASQLELAAAIFEDDENEPSLEHIHYLHSRFGHPNFREKQWEIIDTVMNQRRDVSAVMATGYGKSLCYQFPAIYKNGMVLVVSPLISLMTAQVYALTQAKIKACLVGTAQTDKGILLRIERGEFQIIYSSPEYLQTANGHRLLHFLNGRLTLIAIDGEYSFECCF